MYFLCVLITFQTSCAQLNPAITFALWLKEYSQKSFVTTLLIISSQIIGAFLGLELAMLMRVVYGIDGLQIMPPMFSHLPGIERELGSG